MEWDTLEHSYHEKTNDWYLSVILIASALIIVEFFMNNFLLITLTFIGTIAFVLLAARIPEMIHIEIREMGIREGDLLYPYQSLDAYTVTTYEHETKLLLESNRRLMPLIVIPIPDDIDPDQVRVELDKHLPEKELHESFAHLLLERLGF
ncbi:MAG: hypothetical protein A2845_05760 [Candidatus Lloydbacteria bacterium RIFCSPHIGHO2_01_FULL_49_22]|uniref:DUF5673 domain-containing protein n=1 Tax=Candidatus Lloydbacteria bacterium RIFCSPHIGHO2_01_FULL_49_22 TaxID=1798658 RepID=A0A1G2CXR8_9BACT|nr:MAG: hypothetical protein A2845_05760 [Candidatus Lloydbacteria bacterium RIFCSPHIGHO2_01_FULL_49_22]OGZ09810.1 MAG: hypothetical protein A3C14_00255 [Candidatus Lloydbacteria bacterium RIFCSPHIGHO2_02_FULL_50_18]